MSKVFVLDTNFKQLNPVHAGRARILLSSRKATVYRRYPFTIVLKTAAEAPVEPLRIKIDPGSKTTGMAIVNVATGEVVFAADLSYQGEAIKKHLDKRRSVRRSRRHRHMRYRQDRWCNRRNKLRPSVYPHCKSVPMDMGAEECARLTRTGSPMAIPSKLDESMALKQAIWSRRL